VDAHFSERRNAAAAQAFFERAVTDTEVTPERVTTDKAKCYPPARGRVPAALRRRYARPVQQPVLAPGKGPARGARQRASWCAVSMRDDLTRGQRAPGSARAGRWCRGRLGCSVRPHRPRQLPPTRS
jgi:hypothetical protein